MIKLFERIYWHNNTTPAINEDNLNAMSKAIDDIDNRVIDIADDILEDLPEIIEDLDEVRELVADAESIKSDSEAWSQGTRDGTPVGPTDPTYHNNAKYWAENTGWTISDDQWAEIMALYS